jgi:hypothetical protein
MYSSDRFLAVQDALYPEQKEAVLNAFTTDNPNWRGAHVADILATLVDTDSYLDVTEPLFDEIVFDERGTPRRPGSSIQEFVTPAIIALYLANGRKIPCVSDVELLVRRAHRFSLPLLYDEIKALLVQRGWEIDGEASGRPNGEVHEFVHPETHEKMPWISAILAEDEREYQLTGKSWGPKITERC